MHKKNAMLIRLGRLQLLSLEKKQLLDLRSSYLVYCLSFIVFFLVGNKIVGSVVFFIVGSLTDLS